MLETMKQIDSQLMMRNYEGFLSLSCMSTPSPRLVLLGKQGAGKGTQADAARRALRRRARLDRRDVPRARRRWAPRSASRRSATWTRGELVPDEIVIGVVEECLAPGGPLDDGFVLDGFPRTLHQAEELDRVLDGRPLDVVINLDVPTRDRARPASPGAGSARTASAMYHVNLPPTTNWTCDTCGGDVVQRDDDTEEAIDRRLELYEEQTVPIIDYYRDQSACSSQVDGVGDGDDVFERLRRRSIDQRFDA